MDLRQLECFFAVAEERHFGRAAARLHLGQPTVSEAIRRLEASVGGRLFVRNSREVRLTALGETFLSPAREAYTALRVAYERTRRAAAGSTDTVTVGYVQDLAQPLLPGIAAALAERHPGVTIHPLVVPTLGQGEAVQVGEIELGIGWDTPATPGTRRLEIAPDPYVLIVPASDPLAAVPQLTAAEVTQRPLLFFPLEVNPAHRLGFTDWLDRHGGSSTITHEADGTSNIVALVLAGLGLGVTTQSVASQQRHTGIVYRRLGPDSPCAKRVLLTRDAPPRPALSTLVELLTQAAQRPPSP